MIIKTQRDIERARDNARERQKRGAATRPPTVINWDEAWDRVEAMFAELDGEPVPETSNGNPG